jgi:serine/threonine-protein kinase RsbW
MVERDREASAGHPAGTALRLDAGLEQLAEVRAFIRTSASGLGADDEAVGDLVQAVDEWVTNIIRHGYGGRHGPVEIDVDREGMEIVVRVRDRGPRFDPADAPPFDAEAPLDQRRPGGMGIHLMQDLMGSLAHRALPGGGNELTMRRATEPEAGGSA